MAEFCFCGSLMIDGSCTNKNCINKAKHASGAKTRSPRSSKTADTKQPKKTAVRKSSKVITYSLEELEKKARENIN